MSKQEADTHFDGLANKFAANIYGTTKGQLRHKILIHALKEILRLSPMKVIELGGGTGIMSKAFLEAGHNVMFTDASSEILEHAKRNLNGIGSVDFRHQALQEVNDLDKYDLVVCHAVLEWLHSPLESLSHILNRMKPGSLLSLSFFNHDAALFTNAVYGNLDYLEQGMKVRNQVKLNPKNPLRPKQVIDHISAMGGLVEQVTGVRCFHDYMKTKPANDEQLQKLFDLEMKHCQQAPFKWLGKYIHLLIKKTH